MKWLQLLCGFRKSRDRRARNRLPAETQVAAYEATLEDRVLLSAVSPASGVPEDSLKDGDSGRVSDQPESTTDSPQTSAADVEPEESSYFFMTDAFPLSNGGTVQFSKAESESTNQFVTADSIRESDSSGQQVPDAATANANAKSHDSRQENSVDDLTGLPDPIQTINESKLTSDPASDSSSSTENPLEESQQNLDDSTDAFTDDLVVLATEAGSKKSLPSDSLETPQSVDDAPLAAEWPADQSKQQVGSSIGQRSAAFGRAYAIVPKQHGQVVTVGETATVSGGSLDRSQHAQAVDRHHFWRPFSVLLGGVDRAEVNYDSSAVVRATNWMTGQTRERDRLTLAESTATLATEREFAEAGEGRSQGPSHDSQNHVLIRLETEVAGYTTDVEADDNPPERPDLLGVWQHLKFDCNPRGPPDDDRIPISGFTRRTGSGDQLHQLRFSIAPRGPSVAFRS